jgi:ankyrin repeat protein
MSSQIHVHQEWNRNSPFSSIIRIVKHQTQVCCIVELLLSKGADVNAKGGYYGNALRAASEGGHERIVELLLSKGADVNEQGGVYGDAPPAALSEGHEKIVELLPFG